MRQTRLCSTSCSTYIVRAQLSPAQSLFENAIEVVSRPYYQAAEPQGGLMNRNAQHLDGAHMRRNQQT